MVSIANGVRRNGTNDYPLIRAKLIWTDVTVIKPCRACTRCELKHIRECEFDGTVIQQISSGVQLPGISSVSVRPVGK